ncbi:MAG: crossover junction endodeoxyribonuclease RuvC [Candidatus Microgenomates bacterium]
MLTILGIDPGTHRLGWGVISGNSSKSSYVASGCLENSAHTGAEIYLPTIYQKIGKIISSYQPNVIGIESLLFQKNVSTAISVAEAKGVIRLVAAQNNIPVIESAPTSIKLAVAGSGSADKNEVTRMVGLLLGIKVFKKRDDELDALAVAISTIMTKKRL